MNQRGVTEVLADTEGPGNFIADRWMFSYSAIDNTSKAYFEDDCIVIYQSSLNVNDVRIMQKIEFDSYFCGKTLTFSMEYETEKDIDISIVTKVNDGAIAKVFEKPVFHSEKYVSFTVTVPDDSNCLRVLISTKGSGEQLENTTKIYWAKLELGDHATPYVPRLYAEELELCKRYYQRVYLYNKQTAMKSPQNNELWFELNAKFPMRINPTPKVIGKLLKDGNAIEHETIAIVPSKINGEPWASYTIKSISASAKANHDVFIITVLNDATAYGNFDVWTLKANDGAFLELDAEL